jgi:hypothetical protein
MISCAEDYSVFSFTFYSFKIFWREGKRDRLKVDDVGEGVDDGVEEMWRRLKGELKLSEVYNDEHDDLFLFI